MRDGVIAADIARAENDVFRKHGLGEYTTSEYTRVRGHGMGLFADSKPHLLENVTTRIDVGMALIVHPSHRLARARKPILIDRIESDASLCSERESL